MTELNRRDLLGGIAAVSTSAFHLWGGNYWHAEGALEDLVPVEFRYIGVNSFGIHMCEFGAVAGANPDRWIRIPVHWLRDAWPPAWEALQWIIERDK